MSGHIGLPELIPTVVRPFGENHAKIVGVVPLMKVLPLTLWRKFLEALPHSERCMARNLAVRRDRLKGDILGGPSHVGSPLFSHCGVKTIGFFVLVAPLRRILRIGAYPSRCFGAHDP